MAPFDIQVHESLRCETCDEQTSRAFCVRCQQCADCCVCSPVEMAYFREHAVTLH
jgi:hypothetical protein